MTIAISKRLFICLVVAAGLSAAPGSGRTQSDDRPDEFKKRLADGFEAYKNGEYEQALEAFRRAEQIASPPLLQYNIARTFQKLGRCRDARRLYDRVLDMEDLSDKYRPRAKKHRSKLRAECPEKGTIHVECRPDGARIDLASRETKQCPATYELEPGTYRLTVAADGYRTVSDKVEVEPGTRTSRSVELVEAGSHWQRHWKKYLGYGGLAIGGGTIAAAVVTDTGTSKRLQRLEEAIVAENTEEIRRIRRSAQLARRRATGLYVTGGLLMVGAGALLVDELTGAGRGSEHSRVQLGISPTRVGVRVDW